MRNHTSNSPTRVPREPPRRGSLMVSLPHYQLRITNVGATIGRPFVTQILSVNEQSLTAYGGAPFTQGSLK